MSQEVEVTCPSNQMKKIFTKPSFGMNNVQVLNNGILPPQNQPQIYRGHRKKFGRTYINILHDPRVVRGNTYAAFVIPSSLQMEFLRMKEEEEKRRKLMKIPKQLPRVAFLGKNKRDIIEEEEEEEKKVDSPILKPIENKEPIDDKGYFYEDRPPTPKYISLPAGKEEETQIIDGELFNYDMEVEPILQVLIGRSLIQAQYELIEDYEREEYLKHKAQYEMNREFELLNLQRTEAKHIRKEEERQRRYVQKEQRQKNDCIMQKKLIANVFSKRICNGLKRNSLRQLQERGLLHRHLEYLLNFYVKKVYYPVSVQIENYNVQINTKVSEQINKEEDDSIMVIHHESVKTEQERVAAIIKKKNEDEQKDREEKARLRKEQLERRENRRINRITESITTNIINTKSTRKDITFLPLCDIDELSLKSDAIHCLGSALGEITFIINEVLASIVPENEKAKIELVPFIREFIEEFLLNGLSEIQMLELKYLESPKYDFENIQDERRQEFVEFLKDKRRYISKSLKYLIEMKMIDENIVSQFNNIIADIYFQSVIEPEKIEPDSENQEQEYLDQIKKEQEEAEKKAAEQNAKNEKLKKKIKLTFINPSVFKKKRGNVGGFIVVEPNNIELGNVTVVEEIELQKEEPVKEEGEDEENKQEGGEKNEEDEQGEDKPVEEAQKEVENPKEIEKPKQSEHGDANQELSPEDQAQQQPIAPEKTTIQQTTQMDYLTEIQVYKNYAMPIDTYVFHHGMTQWYQAVIIKSLRQVLKKMNIDLPLIDTFNIIKEKYFNAANELIKYVLETERYIEKTIIPINISCVIKEEEALTDPIQNQNPGNEQAQ